MRTVVILIISLLIAPKVFDQPMSAFQQSVVYTCPMHPEVQSSKPRKCPKCGMKLVAQKPPAAVEQNSGVSQSSDPGGRAIEVVKQAEEYTCSMHPDIRTSAPGTCPKCGMTLVPVTPVIADEFNLT